MEISLLPSLIGTVTSVNSDISAAVTNSGNSKDAVLNFTIPKGKEGTKIIPARGNIFFYAYETWMDYEAPGAYSGWGNLQNTNEYRLGDIAIIIGTISDKNNLECMLYGEVTYISETSLEIKAIGLVTNGENQFTSAVENMSVDFEEPSLRENIQSGETLTTLFGKIKKWLSYLNDLGDIATIDDIENTSVSFTETTTRSNLSSGETLKTLFGKIKKWFSDLRTAAFYGVSNVLTVTSSNYVLDARQGKVLNDKINNIWKTIYPVGTIHLSMNSTNPGTLFGGTWEQISQGRVLVGVNSSDTSFNTVNKTGGEKTHTLTISEVPNVQGGVSAHGADQGSNFWQPNGAFSASAIKNGSFRDGGSISSGASSVTLLNFNNGGGNGAHNNLQPYLTCYMWKHTA